MEKNFLELMNEPKRIIKRFVSIWNSSGLAGLLNGIIGGAFDSVGRISGTLYSLIQNLTGDNKDFILHD